MQNIKSMRSFVKEINKDKEDTLDSVENILQKLQANDLIWVFQMSVY